MKNLGRTLRLQQTRGRLKLTVPPYIESSYLLASNSPAKWLATRQQARSYSCWWYENCITHSAPSLIFYDPLPCRAEPLWALSQAARDGDGQFCHCCFPHMLHSEERGRINVQLITIIQLGECRLLWGKCEQAMHYSIDCYASKALPCSEVSDHSTHAIHAWHVAKQSL